MTAKERRDVFWEKRPGRLCAEERSKPWGAFCPCFLEHGLGVSSESICCGFDGSIRFGQVLRDNADLASDGHEVGIALPSRDDVEM